jgi:hypothetical protein
MHFRTLLFFDSTAHMLYQPLTDAGARIEHVAGASGCMTKLNHRAGMLTARSIFPRWCYCSACSQQQQQHQKLQSCRYMVHCLLRARCASRVLYIPKLCFAQSHHRQFVGFERASSSPELVSQIKKLSNGVLVVAVDANDRVMPFVQHSCGRECRCRGLLCRRLWRARTRSNKYTCGSFCIASKMDNIS